MPTKRVTRDGVFVSYSHVDKKWLERLKVHLKPLERDHQIVIWNDTKLRSGDKWQVEINKALSMLIITKSRHLFSPKSYHHFDTTITE